MASPRPKSPRTPVNKADGESFWDKFGTIGRKKRIKEGKRRYLQRIFVFKLSKVIMFDV